VVVHSRIIHLLERSSHLARTESISPSPRFSLRTSREFPEGERPRGSPILLSMYSLKEHTPSSSRRSRESHSPSNPIARPHDASRTILLP